MWVIPPFGLAMASSVMAPAQRILPQRPRSQGPLARIAGPKVPAERVVASDADG